MSYLVLARKWRPRDFESLVGQEHVVRALTHALTTQRLHHAWLFTGTRGVGKTTLSRILAKSLNCEVGVTATPCGQCMACTQIDAGRYVDYVELDAASNRGVDEMTQLLEQAVYAPTVARFKVYMIDEVHMLSGHAFNAMLKTLEEPPPHVKFILATTDPQKIPATVLSRCLQFNLKQVAPDAIANYLAQVLEQENVGFEVPALRLIGQAASGSMRDALSLTDQAIAYSANDLTLDAVRGMLGSVDQTFLVQLLQALCQADATRVLQVAQRLSERGLSLQSALGDLAILLSNIAILQRVGAYEQEDESLRAAVEELGAQMPTDLVQLFYTIAVHSRQELAIAPDEYAGFVMICLRMLGIVQSMTGPETKLLQVVVPEPSNIKSFPPKQAVATQAASIMSTDESSESVSLQAVDAQDASVEQNSPSKAQTPDVDTFRDERPISPPEDAVGFMEERHLARSEDDLLVLQTPAGATHTTVNEQSLPPPSDAQVQPQRPATSEKQTLQSLTQDWAYFVTQLSVTGMAQQLAMQSVCVAIADNTLKLRVTASALAQGPHVQRLEAALEEALGEVLRVDVSVGDTGEGESAHQIAQQQAAERHQQARQQLEADPFVQKLIQEMGAQIVPGSIRP